MFGKYLDRGIQLFEELVVNLLLRIVRHLDLAVLADHRIRDRAVGVGHTVHGTAIVAQKEYNRIVELARRGVISAHGAAQQHIGKLRRIDVGRNDRARERGQRRADDITVGLHVVLRRLVGIGIYIEVVGSTGRTDKYQRSQSRF